MDATSSAASLSSLLACMIKRCRNISSCMCSVSPAPHHVMDDACNLLELQALLVNQLEERRCHQ